MAFVKALRVTRPMRVKGSRAIYFRERIPADLIERVRGHTLKISMPGGFETTVRVGSKAEHIKFSLRTSDKAEGLRRHATALAELDSFYNSLRFHGTEQQQQPISLTHSQAVKLSESIYRGWAEVDEGGVCEVEFDEHQRGTIRQQPTVLHSLWNDPNAVEAL